MKWLGVPLRYLENGKVRRVDAGALELVVQGSYYKGDYGRNTRAPNNELAQ